ncbi:hypothetical protein PV797_01560 [Clostridiaceae bacterium M8S5]|nr:hypothetical protein PV797_01560 [Clostridiaceae bacterium M8S5]
MKKSIIYVVVLSMLFLASCKNINSSTMSTKTEEINLYTELNEQFNLKEKETVYIRKLTSKKYLIGMLKKHYYAVNLGYYIFDIESKEKIKIEPFSQCQLIDNITFEDGILSFNLNGDNSINGFTRFPKEVKININTGKVESINEYVKLGSNYRPYNLGNNFDKTVLEDIIALEDNITFKFNAAPDAISAGGEFCPNIKVISKEANHIVIDIENITYNEKQLEKIVDNENYLSYKCFDYVDLTGMKHTALDIELNGKKEYTCDFTKIQNDFRNLIIKFK